LATPIGAAERETFLQTVVGLVALIPETQRGLGLTYRIGREAQQRFTLDLRRAAESETLPRYRFNRASVQ
jgi:hypothetical protein